MLNEGLEKINFAVNAGSSDESFGEKILIENEKSVNT